MPHWNELTEQEREAYINQDVVKASSEALRPETMLDALGARQSLRCIFQGSGYLPDDSPLWNLLDPVTLECLRLYHCEGKSCKEIAGMVTVQYLVDGKVMKCRALNRNIVSKLLSAGRKTLRHFREKQHATKEIYAGTGRAGPAE